MAIKELHARSSIRSVALKPRCRAQRGSYSQLRFRGGAAASGFAGSGYIRLRQAPSSVNGTGSAASVLEGAHRPAAIEIADHDPVGVTLAVRDLVNADRLRPRRAGAFELGFHVLHLKRYVADAVSADALAGSVGAIGDGGATVLSFLGFLRGAILLTIEPLYGRDDMIAPSSR
jgi:hypothetical protein